MTDKRSNGDVTSELQVRIDDVETIALIDTGADYSVISSMLAKKLKKVLTHWTGPQIRTAGGHLVSPVGLCTASGNKRICVRLQFYSP